MFYVFSKILFGVLVKIKNYSDRSYLAEIKAAGIKTIYF